MIEILLANSFWARDGTRDLEILHTKLVVREFEIQQFIAIKLAPEMEQTKECFKINDQFPTPTQ